ncbi:MAG: UDP-N-acetylmuramoyl-L-alanyl-D-glutamate--2,6-diaminopimelate ligase [Akkermansiaceae bacterium]
MKLSELLSVLPEADRLRIEDIDAHFVTDYSGKVTEDSVFVAVRGAEADGHDFLDQVIKIRPAAIVAERKAPADYSGLWIQVDQSRKALGRLAAKLAGNPGAAMRCVAITGTNGKTSITHFIHFLLNELMIKTGMIGTVKVHDGSTYQDATHTTPGAIQMQEILGSMQSNDCKAVVMETSSHGLEQRRAEGIPFRVGVFTNLTQDHLDFHGTMEEYFEAKKLLFSQMAEDGKDGVAVINIDDVWGQKLADEFTDRLNVVTYGFGINADFRISDIHPSFKGQEFALSANKRQYLVRFPFVGNFNAQNCVAAIAAVHGLGIGVRDIVKHVEHTPQTPGRVEYVGGERFAVYVDYAHTPDAVAKACETMRELNPARLITVFGCGGDRDTTKRPLMGEAAAKYSDHLFITSDNPRSEVPFTILNDILPGVGETPHELIVDRGEAITRAIEMALPFDVILIAGKGHETYQEINGVKHHFDDRVIARKALVEYSKRKEAEFKQREHERLHGPTFDGRGDQESEESSHGSKIETGSIEVFNRVDDHDPE